MRERNRDKNGNCAHARERFSWPYVFLKVIETHSFYHTYDLLLIELVFLFYYSWTRKTARWPCWRKHAAP